MSVVEMKYCMQCGSQLTMKYLQSEGMEIPFCQNCNDFRFPVFNTAVSMIVTNREKDKILLIKQYGKDAGVLVAGYVNKGEDVEDAVKREVREEMGLCVEEVHFNRSHYFKPSNTLMLNFTAIVSDMDVHSNEEVDDWTWFTIEEAKEHVIHNSLAEEFLLGYLEGAYHFRKN